MRPLMATLVLKPWSLEAVCLEWCGGCVDGLMVRWEWLVLCGAWVLLLMALWWWSSLVLVVLVPGWLCGGCFG